jgi:hypothetical protein
VSNKVLDILFVSAALFGALVSAWYYVAAVLERDRPLSRVAAAGFVGFSLAALVYAVMVR